MRSTDLALLAPLLLSLPGAAQLERQEDERDVLMTLGALADWRARHGETWQVALDPATRAARSVFGGRALPTVSPAPLGEAGAAELARSFVRETRALHGVDPDSLRLDEAVFLPLGTIGTTDKWTVRFEQELGGVPVRGASVNALLGPAGELLSVDARRPLVDGAAVALAPELTAGEAESAARDAFFAREGVAAEAWTSAELVVEPVLEGGRRTFELAWAVETIARPPAAMPLASRWLIAATGEARVLTREELVHAFDVSAQVVVRRSAGNKPDSYPGYTGSLEESPVPHILVEADQGTFQTNGDGWFHVTGVNEITGVEILYDGPWCEVANEAGDEYVLVASSVSGTGNTLVMNSVTVSNELQTAQGNAFWAVNLMRDWIKGVNPFDTTPDFTVDAEVNWDDDTCNARYTGSSIDVSIEFLQSSMNPCANSAYSTIVWHEFGHWLNDEYDSGNSLNGFGEGCADIYANYLADSPLVGEDFLGAGNHVRNAESAKMFCGDDNLGCYGEEHDDGEPLMGAAWGVRKGLKDTLGAAAGSWTADTLFLAWLIAYDDDEITTAIHNHWLVLDDDDGNLQNGTPHYPEINGGFVAQGWPSYPSLSADVWVDAGWNGVEAGSQQQPFDTLPEGLFHLQPSGVLHVIIGAYPALTIDSDALLQGHGSGSVLIGG